MFSDTYLVSYLKNQLMHKQLLFCLLLLCTLSKGYSQLTVDKHFSDHMVLQREQPITLSGNALPGAIIHVDFGAIHNKTTSDSNGHWSVVLPSQKAQSTATSLVISTAEEKIELKDVLIGDVWLLLGQSNMEFELQKESHYQQEKSKLEEPLLRFYNPSFAGKYIYNRHFKDSVLHLLTPELFYSAVDWQVSDSTSAPSVSAVGYYFARRIIAEQKVPIGLINLAIGGAPLESFISVEAFTKDPEFSKKVNGNWLYNDALPEWIRERGRQNTGKRFVYGDQLGPNHGYKPGFAYSSGIKPLKDFPIRGILWYQGESNAQEVDRVMEYNALQQLMVSEFRTLWKQPELPFYYAQLSSIDTVHYKGQLWPLFRNEQRLFLKDTPYTGMAVTSDIGAQHDVHPTDKKAVGERLSRWALRDLYHHQITVSGPLVQRVEYRRNQLIIHFDHIGKGLTFEGDQLLGFYLDGKPTKARIKGRTVVIGVEKKPAEVAYGFASFSKGNLINKEGLPASSFILKVE